MKVHLEVALGGEPVATEHVKGLSPVWERRRICRELSVPKTLLQYLHVCSQRTGSSLGLASSGDTFGGFPFSFLDGSNATVLKVCSGRAQSLGPEVAKHGEGAT